VLVQEGEADLGGETSLLDQFHGFLPELEQSFL
jgi:hypothetical protein